MTHICVSKLTIIGSDNGLSPGRRQAIIWTNAEILLIELPGTSFSEILIEIHTISFKKMQLKMSSAKWRPFCLGLNKLTLRLVQWQVMSVGPWKGTRPSIRKWDKPIREWDKAIYSHGWFPGAAKTWTSCTQNGLTTSYPNRKDRYSLISGSGRCIRNLFFSYLWIRTMVVTVCTGVLLVTTSDAAS